MFLIFLKYSILFWLIIGEIRGQQVLRTFVKRSVNEPITNNAETNSETGEKKKTDLSIEKIQVFENVEDRFFCLDKKKKELGKIIENGLHCEAIYTIYILKSNIYSCYDLYLPIWFYGFHPNIDNPSNFSSVLMEGFFPNGNGTDVIQMKQKTTDKCIFYMRYFFYQSHLILNF